MVAWSAIEIASSMALLGQNVNWSGSRVSGMMVLMRAMTSLSKHFMATDVIVIQTVYLCILGHRDFGGLLETCRYYRLGEG
jgi:hypothetical protein